METVTHEDSPAYFPFSQPRPAPRDEDARGLAMVHLAGGWTSEQIRQGIRPDDGLFHGVADAVDALTAEGMTPGQARKLTGLGDGAR